MSTKEKGHLERKYSLLPDALLIIATVLVELNDLNR